MVVYGILNIINNKYYIGSTTSYTERIRKHKRQFRLGINSSLLQADYDLYGSKNFKFVVLEKVTDVKLLHVREAYWIELKQTWCIDKGYNINDPIMISVVNQQCKKVLAFNRFTGEKKFTFNSIAEASRTLKTARTAIDKVVSSKGRLTIRDLVLIKEEDYNPDVLYTRKAKETYYEPTGKFEGHPIETFNLETKETIKQYPTALELANEFGCRKQYLYRVTSGEKKSFRGMGVRYSN